jgi:hypothetical protein
MMEADPRTRLKEWLASGQARLQPLSFPQRELWEASPVAPHDPANHICSFFEIRGNFEFGQCEEAVREVADRQEAMRTSFLPGKEHPVQLIRSKGEAVLRYRELSPSERTPEGLEAVMAECFSEPFDFVRGPLYRMDMLKRGFGDHVIVFTIHHAVADGWTLGAFVEDLCTAYVIGVRNSGKVLGKVKGLRDVLPPVPMTYSDWAASERAYWQPAEIQRHVEYWRRRLQGSTLLFDRSHSESGASDVPLKKWVTAISPELTDSSRALARQCGTTLFSTLLAIFQIAVFRWSGVRDLVVGTPVANRSKASVRETMGYFSGVVPVRGQVDPSKKFSEALRTVHEETMDAFAHAMPFAELVAALGESCVPGRHAVFDIRFALQNHPIPEIELPGISTRLKTCSTGTARFDLGCELTEEAGGLELIWLYRPSVVTDLKMRELDRIFRQGLLEVSRDSDMTPAAMPN